LPGVESWEEYGQQEWTRHKHLVELQMMFGFQPFTVSHNRQAIQLLTKLAMQTEVGWRVDHRAAAGGGSVDGFYPGLHSSEVRRPGQGQKFVAERA